jgi:hypothetical protein
MLSAVSLKSDVLQYVIWIVKFISQCYATGLFVTLLFHSTPTSISSWDTHMVRVFPYLGNTQLRSWWCPSSGATTGGGEEVRRRGGATAGGEQGGQRTGGAATGVGRDQTGWEGWPDEGMRRTAGEAAAAAREGTGTRCSAAVETSSTWEARPLAHHPSSRIQRWTQRNKLITSLGPENALGACNGVSIADSV